MRQLYSRCIRMDSCRPLVMDKRRHHALIGFWNNLINFRETHSCASVFFTLIIVFVFFSWEQTRVSDTNEYLQTHNFVWWQHLIWRFLLRAMVFKWLFLKCFFDCSWLLTQNTFLFCWDNFFTIFCLQYAYWNQI